MPRPATLLSLPDDPLKHVFHHLGVRALTTWRSLPHPAALALASTCVRLCRLLRSLVHVLDLQAPGDLDTPPLCYPLESVPRLILLAAPRVLRLPKPPCARDPRHAAVLNAAARHPPHDFSFCDAGAPYPHRLLSHASSVCVYAPAVRTLAALRAPVSLTLLDVRPAALPALLSFLPLHASLLRSLRLTFDLRDEDGAPFHPAGHPVPAVLAALPRHAPLESLALAVAPARDIAHVPHPAVAHSVSALLQAQPAVDSGRCDTSGIRSISLGASEYGWRCCVAALGDFLGAETVLEVAVPGAAFVYSPDGVGFFRALSMGSYFRDNVELFQTSVGQLEVLDLGEYAFISEYVMCPKLRSAVADILPCATRLDRLQGRFDIPSATFCDTLCHLVSNIMRIAPNISVVEIPREVVEHGRMRALEQMLSALGSIRVLHLGAPDVEMLRDGAKSPAKKNIAFLRRLPEFLALVGRTCSRLETVLLHGCQGMGHARRRGDRRLIEKTLGFVCKFENSNPMLDLRSVRAQVQHWLEEH